MKLFLSFFFAFNSFFWLTFGAANYKSVRGLDPKESSIEDEGTKEITIKKRQTVMNSETDNSSLFGLQSACTDDCNYIVFGFTNPVKTTVSDTAFGELEKMNFAKPIADKRFGIEMAFGGKLGTPYLGYELGIMYDLAYFKNTVDDDGNTVEYEYGLHIISPTFRLLLDAFPADAFSLYIGAEVGFAILDFVYSSEYSVKYAPKFGGLTGISYKFGESKSFETFLGYRIIAIPEKEFEVLDVKYKTKFLTHGIHLGVKIKI